MSSFYTHQILTKSIPNSKYAILLRTDFTNDSTWSQICLEIQTPEKQHGFLANISYVNDSSFKSYSAMELGADTIKNYPYSFIFFADSVTNTNPEHPVLCIGLKKNKSKSFRVIPSEVWGVENNLSISNMDFEDFSKSADHDGVFRGFK
ncbi:MAG: hypothetical protein M3R17_19935 [Bacteroidota bacterium]|nr:hypothetical protein [Bacteroidota bacterium]